MEKYNATDGSDIPLGMGSPFTPQTPAVAPRTNAGVRKEVSELRQQVSQVQTTLEVTLARMNQLTEMMAAQMASQFRRSTSDQSRPQNRYPSSQSSPELDHSDSES
ncbi:hypothetical protein CFOL_v3_07573 [Cephalotus follicularis]|uniref:Uncharacterized protein n=1 Tax=Cephalotus follicularis TaxID=3775 RepID=A0A1Q3B829_CEPFO|nr:hypothetical protein CFOL_v3_07573 [Cephalotus follicularis]